MKDVTIYVGRAVGRWHITDDGGDYHDVATADPRRAFDVVEARLDHYGRGRCQVTGDYETLQRKTGVL